MNTRLTPLFGGLLLVALAAAGCGTSYNNPMSPSTTPTPAGTLTIRISATNGAESFTPNPSSIMVGQRVAFYNADGTAHRIDADAKAFDTDNLNPGATSASFTMSNAGVIGYRCKLHPSIEGTLTVVAQ